MGTVADALNLLIAATTAASQLAPIIAKAQAEGRTDLTAEEWAVVTGNDDSAEAALSAAVKAALAAGK
jgi:hypothetical protein